MRGKKGESPDGSPRALFALSRCRTGLKKRATGETHANEAAHRGDQRDVVERARVVSRGIDRHINQIGGHGISSGRKKENPVNRAPGAAFPEKRNARGNGKQLVSNRVRNIEIMVVSSQI